MYCAVFHCYLVFRTRCHQQVSASAADTDPSASTSSVGEEEVYSAPSLHIEGEGVEEGGTSGAGGRMIRSRIRRSIIRRPKHLTLIASCHSSKVRAGVPHSNHV